VFGQAYANKAMITVPTIKKGVLEVGAVAAVIDLPTSGGSDYFQRPQHHDPLIVLMPTLQPLRAMHRRDPEGAAVMSPHSRPFLVPCDHESRRLCC